MNIVWASAREPEVNKAFCDFVSFRVLGEVDEFGPCTTMGVFEEKDGENQLVGATVYHNYDPRSQVIEISGASTTPRWLTREVLHEMFAYPFDQLGCQMVIMRVAPSNRVLARILTVIGFNAYKVPRLRGRNEDGIIFTLTDDDWRNSKFQRKVIGNEERAQAA